MRGACFWISAGGAAWVLVGYPLALALRRPRPWRQAAQQPGVSIVVPAYRERDELRAKLAALRRLDYPTERVEVLVAVDGDRDVADVARREGAAVDFSPERQGKAAALERALRRARGDVVVLTDANNVLEPGGLRAAMRHLADPEVWAVAGRRGEAGSPYDRYEDLIRRLESRSGSVAAMSGEFMAVRRERLPRFPDGVVNDDLWLLCQLVRAGGRVVYEPAAGSSEPALGARAELARRSRMGAGRALLARELLAAPPGFAWRIASHKLGRLVLPFLLLAAQLASLSLATRPLYRALALAQAGPYALALAALAGLEPAGRVGAPMRAARQFVIGNAAVAVGVIRAARGLQSAHWEPVR